MTMNNAPIGSRKFAENLSIKSKNVISPKVNMESFLKLNVQKTPKNNETNVPIHVAVLRLILCSSDKNATITSSKEMVDVNAAIASNTKKMIQKKYPPAILSKIIGKVLNANPAPASG